MNGLECWRLGVATEKGAWRSLVARVEGTDNWVSCSDSCTVVWHVHRRALSRGDVILIVQRLSHRECSQRKIGHHDKGGGGGGGGNMTEGEKLREQAGLGRWAGGWGEGEEGEQQHTITCLSDCLHSWSGASPNSPTIWRSDPVVLLPQF